MTAQLRRSLPWLLPALALVLLALTFWRSTREVSQFEYQDFAELPVLANGRVQPLDSIARNSLLLINGKQTLATEDGTKMSAIQWLTEVLFDAPAADRRPLFLIYHDDVLGLLGLKQTEEKRFSFEQIEPGGHQIDHEAARIGEKEIQLWDAYERGLMKLQKELVLYTRLRTAVGIPGTVSMAETLDRYHATVARALIEIGKREKGDEFDQEAISAASTMVRPYFELADRAYFHALPPQEPEEAAADKATDDREPWLKFGDAMVLAIDEGGFHPGIETFGKIGDAFRSDDPAAFNTAVASYREWIPEFRPSEFRKAKQEAFFNRLGPFYLCMILYVLALLCALGSWLKWGPELTAAGFRLLLLALVIHTGGLIFRMMLEGRPPVTNLYSSAVFIGWGAVVLSAVLEKIYKNSIGTAVAAIVGFATLLIAHHLSLGGDTLEMMRAVLDSNFWLATHVIVITLGYSATFLAGTLAIIYIIRRAARSLDAKSGAAMRSMVYGIICFATLFSFVGTILGGIWADQSWGRFWGWDPKENGALLIVLWNAIILHARWGGLVKERGLMVMAVFGNIVTSWSWFGTNMLGIGLHSYGFMDAAYLWLIGFIISQLVIMAIGMLPWPATQRDSRTARHAPTSPSPAPEPRSSTV